MTAYTQPTIAKPVAAKRGWLAPRVSRLRAGEAENGFVSRQADGPLSMGS